MSAVERLGINENNAVLKVKDHIINGGWEDQRTGLIEALYGTEINGSIISKRKLSYLVDNAIYYTDSKFNNYMKKLLMN